MFANFSIIDIVDVLLVAAILYYFYRLMKESGSLNVFIGILVFFFTWVIVSLLLDMRLLGSIMDQLMSVGTIALIVIFHEEVRNFFKRLGSNRRLRFISSYFSRKDSEDDGNEAVVPIVLACASMAQQKVGALIVIEKNVPLNEIIRSGETIHADVNQRLIENIFFKNSPLHDGAMIIRHKQIIAAGCILPVSHDLNIPKELGLRHRAAMGVSQETDALAIIVSEETGGISVAYKSQFHLRLTAEELERILTKEN